MTILVVLILYDDNDNDSNNNRSQISFAYNSGFRLRLFRQSPAPLYPLQDFKYKYCIIIIVV